MLEGRDIRIRSALQYRWFVGFIMLKIVLKSYTYVDYYSGAYWTMGQTNHI